jgi:restriction system protein
LEWCGEEAEGGGIMAIPDYQTLMLPVLQAFADGKDHSYRQIIEELAKQFHLTEEQRQTLLPSGRQAVFDNRVGWAKTYLSKALLIEQVQRGIFRITERGKKVLANKPEKINNKFLRQFPEFLVFQERSSSSDEETQHSNNVLEVSVVETPNERIENAFGELRSALSKEVIERVTSISPARFERLVVELLVKMGYGGALPDAGKMTKLIGDEGIDGVIKEDKLGLDMIYLQAKRWHNTTVGRPEIQKFVGALAGQKAQKGVFITTSAFSKEAREYAASVQQKVVLIDGEQLADLMIEYDLGVSIAQTYLVKRIDNDYFDENLD